MATEGLWPAKPKLLLTGPLQKIYREEPYCRELEEIIEVKWLTWNLAHKHSKNSKYDDYFVKVII